ncbi:MAG: hypothetical protein IPK32_09715 [Verrucomicrobiaceae bacterium]|nr:hypothetical protein [Verrucomicrobiaceae bacterium]
MPTRQGLALRLATVFSGHALYASFNWCFDNLLYVYAVHRLGLLYGGAVMTFLAGLQCGATLLLYERMRIDWVGAGSLTRLVDLDSPTWWQRVLLWAVQKGDAFVFVALCVFQDAFITTAYFRRGRFDGLTARDRRIFVGSVLVSNLYWTLRSGVVSAALAGVWHRFQS